MKTKKILAGVLACTFLFGGINYNNTAIQNININANAIESGTYECLTYTKYDNYIEITDCDISATEVVIPGEIDGLPVTNIGDSAFEACENLISATIPEGVTSIGEYGFADCKNLASIILPESVTSIGNRAFIRCYSLTSITIPNSVTSIGKRAFYSCDALTTINIPKNVTDISVGAFTACSNLSEITVDKDNSSYSSIDGILFNKDLTELLQCPGGKFKTPTEYTITETITSVGEYAFFSCNNIKSVIIPKSVTSIKSSSFKYCYDLTSVTILNNECEIFDSYETISSSSIEPFFPGVIYGYENSTAQTYADTYGYTFESIGEEPVQTSTTTISETTTTTTTITLNPDLLQLGDVNSDGSINASDASSTLAEYANLSSGGSPVLNIDITDVNKDGTVNASDASSILAYYAYTSSGGTDSIEKFIEN